MTKFYKIFFIAVLLSVINVEQIWAQNTPNQILNNIFKKTQKVKDYSVNANIKIDLPFIKMLPIDAKIYFKQKDKFKVESKSIAIVPRQGFDQFSKMLIDTNQFSSFTQGTEMIGGSLTKIINVIPISDTSDLILGKLWIDEKQNIVLKSQLSTKSNGTILTQYVYGAQAVYGLPDMMIFTVDIKKFKIPKSIGADINKNSSEINKKKKESKTGTIIIKLSNYEINKGIPDTVFNKK